MLDATADSATLGKTAGKDAAANKPTYVSILGLEPSQGAGGKIAARRACGAGAVRRTSGLRLRELADLIVQRKA